MTARAPVLKRRPLIRRSDIRPPGRLSASSRVTQKPFFLSRWPAVSPASPAPMIVIFFALLMGHERLSTKKNKTLIDPSAVCRCQASTVRCSFMFARSLGECCLRPTDPSQASARRPGWSEARIRLFETNSFQKNEYFSDLEQCLQYKRATISVTPDVQIYAQPSWAGS